MSLAIIDRSGILTEDLRVYIERRLRFALTRFDAKIHRTTVVLEDTNGPRGGVDKSCSIHVKLQRASSVKITDQDADLARCVARAAERAGRAVRRAIERAQRLDRSKPPVPDSTITS